MSKIIVICRTFNARPHIARFLYGYGWADEILIADGGSTDGTDEFVRTHPKVRLKYFLNYVCKNGVYRNPEGAHLNYMIDWAESRGADWIILDDADSVPTTTLREAARHYLDSTPMDTVWAFRLYIWRTRKWFPSLTGSSHHPEDKWAGLWAWRPGQVRWSEEDPFKSEFEDIEKVYASRRLILRYPAALLHYFCLTQEIEDEKREFYNKTLEGGQLPVLESCGPLEDLPKWATP